MIIAEGRCNPQAKINDEWTNLRPLKTEGQGLPGGADEYSRITAVIPFGIGVKIGISDMWRIGLEVSYNKTFTDYIDDVSTNYFDPVVLQSQVGSDAVFAANPSKENQTWFVPGEQRGDPDEKDAFYIALEKALHNYLKAKLHIETSDLSKDKINTLLIEKGVEGNVIKDFESILESCELARYTPIDIVTMQEDYEKAAKTISLIDKQAR